MVKKVVKKEKINLEIPAYVFGVLSIIQAFFNPLSAIVIGAFGLVFSKRQITPLSEKARKLNIWGLVLGIVFSILVLVVSLLNPQQLAGL